MNLSTKIVYESKVLPGVRVTLKRFSVARRAALELELAEYRQQLYDISAKIAQNQIDWGEIDGKICETCGHAREVRPGDPIEVRRAKAAELLRLRNEIEVLANAYLKPAYLRRYVAAIDGLELDGQPATIDMVIEECQELADEIYDAIQERCGLSVEERGNLQRPGTSGEAEQTSSNDSTASSVRPEDNSTSTTAESSPGK